MESKPLILLFCIGILCTTALAGQVRRIPEVAGGRVPTDEINDEIPLGNKDFEPTGQVGTCYSADCQDCRASGFSDAHDQCVGWIVGVASSHKLRYQYTGATEGHDGAANLLMYKGEGVSDVCNVSKGTCCGTDSGCPFWGWGSSCSGSSASRVCTASQSCVGQFGSGGPMMGHGAYTPLGFTGRIHAEYGARPYDCDCTSGVDGGNAGFEIYVNADGTIWFVSLWGPSHPPSGAGTLSTQGWTYQAQTYKALTCGTYHDGVGCIGMARQIRFTHLDYESASGGNPDFFIAQVCY